MNYEYFYQKVANIETTSSEECSYPAAVCPSNSRGQGADPLLHLYSQDNVSVLGLGFRVWGLGFRVCGMFPLRLTVRN